MNDENLIPISKRTEQERKEMGRKGGIASGAARRRKKEYQRFMSVCMEVLDENPDIADKLTKKAKR